LSEQEFDVNGLVVIITDGVNNIGQRSSADVSRILKEVVMEEQLESLKTILVGVNTRDAMINDYLNSFKKDAGIDQYVDSGEATPEKLARLADFVSKSISAQSQALGTGGPSQSLVF